MNSLYIVYNGKKSIAVTIDIDAFIVGQYCGPSAR